jgi:hypothetical protein
MVRVKALPKAHGVRTNIVLTPEDKAVLANIRSKTGKATMIQLIRMGLRLVAAEVGAGEPTKS